MVSFVVRGDENVMKMYREMVVPMHYQPSCRQKDSIVVPEGLSFRCYVSCCGTIQTLS